MVVAGKYGVYDELECSEGTVDACDGGASLAEECKAEPSCVAFHIYCLDTFVSWALTILD